MINMLNKKKSASGKTIAAFTIGAAAGAALASYALDLGGVRSKPRRAMNKIKGDVLSRMNDAAALTKRSYQRIVDEVVAGYVDMQAITAEEAARIKTTLQDAWDEMRANAIERTREALDEMEDDD